MRTPRLVQYPPEQLQKLAEALEHKVTDQAALNILYDGVQFAARRNMVLTGLYDPGSVKDAKEGAQRLQTALDKLLNRRGTVQAALRSLRAGVQSLKRHHPMALTELDAYGSLLLLDMPEAVDHETGERISIFERVVQGMTDQTMMNDARTLKPAVDEFLNRYGSPGRGGARKDAKRWIPAIQTLAESFREALPDRVISPNENTLFPLYVAFFADPDSTKGPDMTRHIRNALEDLKHWEKVSL